MHLLHLSRLRPLAVLALGLVTLGAFSRLEAQSQSVLAGKTLTLRITNGAAPFATTGTQTLTLDAPAAGSYTLDTGTTRTAAGTYTYASSNLGALLTLNNYFSSGGAASLELYSFNAAAGTGGFETYSGTASNSGTYVISTGSGSGTTSAPVITNTPTQLTATVGQAFSYQLNASPAATSFSNEGGNATIAINPLTGLVTGTFNTAGSFTFSARAHNSAGSSPTVTFTVVASAGTGTGTAGTITNDALLPANLVGRTLSFRVTSPTNTLNDGPNDYNVTFQTADFLQRTAEAFTWLRTSYTAETATGDGGVRLTTIRTFGTWSNSALGYGTILTLSQLNGIGRFTIRDVNDPTRANSGTFTISAASTGNTGGTGTAPTITAQPAPQTVAPGGSVSFSAEASGIGLTYQWLFNNVPIIGATSATYTLAQVTLAQAGNYSVRITNAAGVATTSSAATLTVSAAAPISFLGNVSVRARAGSGDAMLIVGVTIGGAPTGSKNVLIRGIGPALGAFGVPDALADPVLNIFRGSAALTTNDDWGTEAGIAAISSAVGAFPLVAGSRDAAVNGANIGPGSYTIQLSGKAGATGNGLIELYDTTAAATVSTATARFTNLSARTFGGTGGDTLIVGFNLAGPSTRRLLIRAVGPGLAAFGLTGTMPDPKLELYRAQTKLGENDNWEAASLATQQSVGAFNLPAASRDAVLISPLPAGSYTVQVTGSTTGVVLVEVYELP